MRIGLPCQSEIEATSASVVHCYWEEHRLNRNGRPLDVYLLLRYKVRLNLPLLSDHYKASLSREAIERLRIILHSEIIHAGRRQMARRAISRHAQPSETVPHGKSQYTWPTTNQATVRNTFCLPGPDAPMGLSQGARDDYLQVKRMTKRALICGISGQDGAYLARLLLNKDYEVHGISRDAEVNPFYNLEYLGIKDRIHLNSSLLTDFRSVISTLMGVRPDEIYNLSGQSSVSRSFVETLREVISIVGTKRSVPLRPSFVSALPDIQLLRAQF